MKVKEKPEIKFASKKFQDEHEEQGTWKRKEREIIWKYWGAKEVRCNLLITELFHIQMGAAGGWVWPLDSSWLPSCRGLVTCADAFAESNYTFGLVSVLCWGQNDMSKNTEAHCVAGWSLIRRGGSVSSWSVGATRNGVAVYWWERWKTRTQEPSCISLSSRYSCNLSHSYLISTRVSGQTNVLLISSLLLPKWGRAARERAGQEGVRSRDWKKENGRGENGAAKHDVLGLDLIIFRLDIMHFLFTVKCFVACKNYQNIHKKHIMYCYWLLFFRSACYF